MPPNPFSAWPRFNGSEARIFNIMRRGIVELSFMADILIKSHIINLFSFD